jgi:hypothetical protein
VAAAVAVAVSLVWVCVVWSHRCGQWNPAGTGRGNDRGGLVVAVGRAVSCTVV